MKMLEIVFLFIFSFLPPVIYVVWIRNTEKFNREKWFPIFICFFWGATIAIIASLILEMVLHFSISPSIENYNTMGYISVVIIAPFVEELTKPVIMSANVVKKELQELEDGLIYGAVAGLGFSATENLFYGYNAYITEGFLYFFLLILIRSIGGCLLHASATSLTGYGYGKRIMQASPFLRIIPYFLLAIFVHAFYNALLSFNLPGLFTGLVAALVFAIITITIVRKRIIYLDSISGK